MERGDYFKINELSDEDFIKLHQALEDKGFKMYETTKFRIKHGKPEYDYLKWSDEGICGTNNPDYCKNRLNISDFINQDINYEIY